MSWLMQPFNKKCISEKNAKSKILKGGLILIKSELHIILIKTKRWSVIK